MILELCFNLFLYENSLIFPGKVVSIEDRFGLNYEGLLEVIVVILISCGTILVIITPIFLISFWLYFSVRYVNEYRSRFSVKKWITGRSNLGNNIPRSVWMNYENIYSNMIGYGISIGVYSIATNMYMMRNFDKMENALIDYFSFPFKVFTELQYAEYSSKKIIPLDEIWYEMLIIVGASFLAMIMGYALGSFIVAYRYKSFTKMEASSLEIKRMSKGSK